MENTFKEMCSLLENGPVVGKDNVFLEVFNILLSCTQQVEAKPFFSDELISHTLKFLSFNSPYNNVIFKILINLFSEEDLSVQLCKNKSLMVNIINISLNESYNKNSVDADSSCCLLSNITRSQINCEKVTSYISSLSETLLKIVSVFTTIEYNSKCTLDQLAMVLCNLSQVAVIRDLITQSNNCILAKIVPFMNHESPIRRRGVIGVVHNLSFNSSLHTWMLSEEVDILPRILLPLAGPEQFDDEDNDKLPIDLQYLSETKTREPFPEIRTDLLETLNQLCATKFGRQYLRDHNTYIILRELHKWEEDTTALLACENVVDILIRTEDEIGTDHLKTMEIPADVEEKFNKELNSLV